MPPAPAHPFKWRPDNVAKILLDHGITNRHELAEYLEPLGITRATVYRAFNPEWCGWASDRILWVVAKVFSAPLALLVGEPSEDD